MKVSELTPQERRRLIVLRLRVTGYYEDGWRLLTHHETNDKCFYKLQHERNRSMLVIHASLDDDTMQEVHDGKSTISNIHV